MATYKTPGVYVEEAASLPSSVIPVATAIPAFIGYTQKRPDESTEAHKISSLKEFDSLFGSAFHEMFSAEIARNRGVTDERVTIAKLPEEPTSPYFKLYYSLQMFFANGGGACYIVSVGTYRSSDTATLITSGALIEGLNVLAKEDEPTLILFPDATGVLSEESITAFYTLFNEALTQCARLKDRFALIDLHDGEQSINQLSSGFRGGIGTNNLSYGAAYYPWLLTNVRYAYEESEIRITETGSEPEPDDPPDPPAPVVQLKYDTSNSNLDKLDNDPDGDGTDFPDDIAKKYYYEARSLFHIDNKAYTEIKSKIESFRMKLPPSSAIAGIYARVDRQRGVFKAPANESLKNVIQPLVKIDNSEQDEMNEHSSGKSINAIRSFTNKGVLVWGARTLAGNSNEWRYISVRRFFIFAEESIKKAVEAFVFEANNENTWIRVRGLIENFLTQQWKAGALVGSTPKQAFVVQVGLGETMTALDVLEGKLIVSVGMATVRPAEFIILKFMHKLQQV